ncbi:UNVERIFIED_CONTAM: hypothetical protein Scaly_1833100 [Sesamum calycinum]|uniref:DUF1308 domain-containing protein n=1 Tax=Sesamum calycinum TaxID=2727403 RepID=A0AAW2NE08_9LAMI
MEERERVAVAFASAVEDAKRRCVALTDRLHRISKPKLSSSPKTTLFRLIHSELTFLHRLSATFHPLLLSGSFLFPFLHRYHRLEKISTAYVLKSSQILYGSSNIGHLEAVVHVLQQPCITGVSRVCKPIILSPLHSIYVDIVCSLNGSPVWFIVSDRNPRYISWDGGVSDKNKGLKKKIQQVIDAARESPVTLKPVPLCFSFPMVLMIMFIRRLFPDACVFQIEVDQDVCGMEKNIPEPARMDGHISCKKCDVCSDFHLGTSLQSLVSGMKCWCCSLDNVELDVGFLKQSWRDVDAKLVNFDTTAMVAIVSGISNGRTAKLLALPESEIRGRFKGNYDFVIAQVDSENQNPIHSELLSVISGKRGIICESVRSEFQELVTMCGGPNEKLRAEYFLKFLKVVPDCPSTRLMSLPTTRKLALKNKVVFGTGDYWYAPTITANMAFVRAVSQTGMSLSVIEHRPRALIGD